MGVIYITAFGIKDHNVMQQSIGMCVSKEVHFMLQLFVNTPYFYCTFLWREKKASESTMLCVSSTSCFERLCHGFVQFVTGISLWTPRFEPRLVHVGFAVYKVVLRQIFNRDSLLF